MSHFGTLALQQMTMPTYAFVLFENYSEEVLKAHQHSEEHEFCTFETISRMPIEIKMTL